MHWSYVFLALTHWFYVLTEFPWYARHVPWVCSVRSEPRLNIKTVFPGIRRPMLKIRWPWDSPIFNMGIPILIIWHLYIETAPGSYLGLENMQIAKLINLHVSAACLYIPFTVLIAPEHFHAFHHLWERANCLHRDFGPEKTLAVEMNFLTPSAEYLHCPSDICRTSCMSSLLLHLLQMVMEVSAFWTASRMFEKLSRKHMDSAKDISC